MKKIILFLMITSLSFCQERVELGFNEHTNFYSSNRTLFKVTDKNHNLVYSGENINKYDFKLPGLYQVDIEEATDHKSNSCNHPHLPKKSIINVSPFNVKFVNETLVLSKDIKKNVDTNGILLQVDVEVSSFNNQDVLMNDGIVKTSGIGSEIIGKIDEKSKILKVGRQTITYHLSGLSTEASYIMFDFVAPNGTIQGVSLLKQISN